MFKIIDEIERVLKPNGLLLLRVNSVKDVNHGSSDGEEVEKHFRRTLIDGYKRFFDRDEIEHFFNRFEIIYANEEPMNGRYERDKILWKVICRYNKNKN
jgi:methylase of polypeptide subunit release factors